MAQTVKDFLNNPQPTILPMDTAGTPALPLASHMVAGSPYPHSASTKMATFNRYQAGQPAVPVGVTYNAPRSRMVQV